MSLINSKKTWKWVLILIGSTALIGFVFFTQYVEKKEPIRIGVVGTMSGLNSDLSVSGRRGVELAISERNAIGGIKGHKIEIVLKDDKNDSSIAQQKREEFIKGKIQVVIGHYTSGMMLATYNGIKDKEILYLSPTVSADQLSGMDDNFIRFIASTKEQAVVLSKETQKRNIKRIAIIFDQKNIGFNEMLIKNFNEKIIAYGGNIILSVPYSVKDAEAIENIVNQVKSSSADAVFIIAGSEDCAKFAQEIHKSELKIQILAPLWANTTELIKKGGTAVNGMLIVGGINPDNKSETFVEFEKKYEKMFSEKPTFASIYSYEATLCLLDAIGRCQKTSSENIKREILKIKSYKGIQGSYEIDKFGDKTREYMVFEIMDGTQKQVTNE